MKKTAKEELIPLGATDIKIYPMGIGTWSWGDRLFWGFGKDYHLSDVKAVFDNSLAAGINLFDTAEMYGFGRSERILGDFASQSNLKLVIASKFFPFPWRLGKSFLRRALRGSLSRMHLPCLDLYQMHWPLPPVPITKWMEAMAEAHEAGRIKAVGVSNYNADQTRRAFEALRLRGLPLASNQIPFSLLSREAEHSGLIEVCRELGITVIAYSPLAQGYLTGKYTPENMPEGPRKRRYSLPRVAQIQSLIALMEEIGQEHGAKTPAQVAINWAICKGTVPIPGAKNALQAQENLGALGWRLSAEEVAAIEQAATPCSARQPSEAPETKRK